MANAISGKYSFTITYKNQSYVLNSQGKGDIVDITFPNPLTTLDVGKNQNSGTAMNWSGLEADIKLIVFLSQTDDEFMQGIINDTVNQTYGLMTLTGTVYTNDDGVIGTVSVIIRGASMVKIPSFKESSEGATDAKLAVYEMKGVYESRVISS